MRVAWRAEEAAIEARRAEEPTLRDEVIVTDVD